MQVKDCMGEQVIFVFIMLLSFIELCCCFMGCVIEIFECIEKCLICVCDEIQVVYDFCYVIVNDNFDCVVSEFFVVQQVECVVQKVVEYWIFEEQ